MFARLLAVALGLLVFVPALAYATPPDPIWPGGFYDDDDYDDVILLITGMPSAPPTGFIRCSGPDRTPCWLTPAADEPLPPPGPAPREFSRGPPRA